MKLYSKELIKKIVKTLDNDTIKGIVKAAFAGAAMYAGKEMLNGNFMKQNEDRRRPVTSEEFTGKLDAFSKVAKETESNYYKLEEAKKIVRYMKTLNNAPGEWYEKASKAIGDIADQCSSWYYKGQITDLMNKF